MSIAKRNMRRERTFVGVTCAACEEPIEHILRGEHIIRLVCGHILHEACFCEYIKDSNEQNCPCCNHPLGVDWSRGGNINVRNLNKLASNVHTPDLRERPESKPTPWDKEAVGRTMVVSRQHLPQSPSKAYLLSEEIRHGHIYDGILTSSHARNESGDTGAASRSGNNKNGWNCHSLHNHEYQSSDRAFYSPQLITTNPIPTPTITIRCEFPTLPMSRQQQSLTCLVTVEVVEETWYQQEHFRSLQYASLPPVKERNQTSPRTPAPAHVLRPVDSVHEDMALEGVREDLFRRVENWHGLEIERFGRLLLYGTMHVGKDRQTWQLLECFLFSEMIICVRDKTTSPNASGLLDDQDAGKSRPHCALKGSILVKRHLKQMETSPEDRILTLVLSVDELPTFHMHFTELQQLDIWRKALFDASQPELPVSQLPRIGSNAPESGEERYAGEKGRRAFPNRSLPNGAPSPAAVPSEHSSVHNFGLGKSAHIPLDIVVVLPVSSSMHGLKMNILRDSLRFLVSILGDCDRMGLVTYGSGGGGMALVNMETKTWRGWKGAFQLLRPAKNMKADAVEGANVAMDLLMQRRTVKALSHILLISDSSTSHVESVDFVVSRAEAAKVSIHTFGLGLTHKPDTLVEISAKTKASYTYVKDWMTLRECLAGCFGALQSTSHQNAKLLLRLPEGSTAKFVKISGAFHVSKRATGRDAEVSLGDLRFGDKRDILVQLAIQPDNSSAAGLPSDPWESMISSLKDLGPMEQDDRQTASVEELPLIQADLVWGDILREGAQSQLPRPSLLAITMLPLSGTEKSDGRPCTPPIPPHPSIVQRRMELLTSDMLSRALNLIARGQNNRAQHLLLETKSILKGLGKGGLPPLPTPPPTTALPPTPDTPGPAAPKLLGSPFPMPPGRFPPSSSLQFDLFNPVTSATVVDKAAMAALDTELECSLEWISHPAVFNRDSRKAILQAIGVISSQQAYTFRTSSERFWAARIPGVRRLTDRSREWREAGDQYLTEE